MRNLLLVILISASSVWASDSYSQNTQLKLSATEGTIESIFNQISKQSRLEFFYNTNILNAKEKVSLSIKDRKSTRLNSSHRSLSRMPSSA